MPFVQRLTKKFKDMVSVSDNKTAVPTLAGRAVEPQRRNLIVMCNELLL